MKRFPIVKLVLATALVAASQLAVLGFKTHHATDAPSAPGEPSSGTFVRIIDAESATPPAIVQFENPAESLRANLPAVAERSTTRVRPFVGTVFDDPTCRQFQEFEPFDVRRPWLAPGPDFSAPIVGGYLLAF